VDSSGSDQLAGLGTDAQGNIYLAGTTQSPNFRVKAAVQNGFAGTSDVFVTKLDPNGNVVYSTYFGGSGGDVATAMTVDPNGSVYVAGTTSSTDFPTTAGAYSSTLPSPSGAGAFVTFLFKLNADGSLGYSTYFSNSQTLPNAVAVDSAGSAPGFRRVPRGLTSKTLTPRFETRHRGSSAARAFPQSSRTA
jgi:hypothetical protein